MKTAITVRRLAANRGVLICTLLACATGSVQAADPGAQGMFGFSDGEQVYAHLCQACHMPDGRGAQGAGHYPALAGDPALASANFVAATILNGRRNMPSFRHVENFEFFFGPTWLTDTQVANVVNYVRTHFGNRFEGEITPAEVAALHP
ncbi:MAG TPA: cytochrome c [Dokdonella sp.]|jgi:mono/diheme cytochrome c family protein|nr:cytochrome c [Dokdonella sp.]MCB1571511.1 cytochrome c [Xanthomonadales bacterium]MCB1574757.1 cytochrome c [Xanthomonadales bacterium]MCB1577601.1 cytochrome c [Xanthomonadales bacterium]HMM68622.1 cytochrome c [Dokdonella sp.]